jgi:tetratricopeptide (TPR) repeat protein
MRKGLSIFLPFWILLCIVFPVAVLAATPLDRWHTFVADGASNESKGEHETAIGSFALAAAEAEKNKLPVKFLEIALCRQTEVEILANQVAKAEPHYQHLVSLVKADKLSGSLDPEVGVWLVDLADTYQARLNPKIREDCLKHACQLKSMTFGGAHHECTDCLMQLARYYFEHDRLDNGAKTLDTILTVKSKTMGSDPSALGNMLNFLAIGYKNQGRYDLAGQLENRVIKMSNENSSSLQSGLPAFYLLLGMNCLAQGKKSQANQFYANALQQCQKISDTRRKDLARIYLELLLEPIRLDRDKKRLAMAEAEFKQLMQVQKTLRLDPRYEYGACTLLADVLLSEGKFREAEEYLTRAIDIAKLPNSCVGKDLPDLYLRLAMVRSCQRHIDAADKTFVAALSAESDKSGFHSTHVYLMWTQFWQSYDRFDIALEKLKPALKNAGLLPPEKRGTLLADALEMMSQIESHNGRPKEAKTLRQSSAEEVQLQHKLNSKLGPDIFHRL